MFGIGFSEIVLICLVMIIFIRPSDLPKALRTAGRYFGKIKKMYNELILVKDRIVKEMDEVANMEEKTTNAAPSATVNPEPADHRPGSEQAAASEGSLKDNPQGKDVQP